MRYIALLRDILLRVLIGGAVLCVIGAGVMAWYAPVSSKGSIAGVALGTGDGNPYRHSVRVSRRNLGCTNASTLIETCRTIIGGKELRLEIDHDLPRDVPNQFQFARCTATYGDRSWLCRYGNSTTSGSVYATFYASDLGIPPDMLATLRTQNIIVNQPESTWFAVAKAVAFALPVGFALVVLLSPELGGIGARLGTATVGGFFVFTLAGMIALWLLFGLEYAD